MTSEQLLIVALFCGLILVGGLAVRRGAQLARLRAPYGGGDTRPRTPSIGPSELLAMADDADLGLLRVDGEGRIELANRRAHQIAGRAAGRLAGLSTMEAFVDHRVDELVREARRHGSAEGELALGGEPQRTLLVRARGEVGDGALWLIVSDISELRRLQRIRTEFLDNLAHELRTPLTNVRLLTETLATEMERTEVPPRIRERIERIDVESGHLAQMVTELLDLARIEQGATTLRRDAVDLGGVAGSALARLRLYAERQGVAVRGEAPGTPAQQTVAGDEARLEQLLVNLLHNAIKFSPAGGKVVVRVVPQPDEVRLEVEDSGPGIPRRELERIFERFYKVDRARTRAGAGGGTGLGLSIARHIVEGHGGRIWAESQEGRGARFQVSLPRDGRIGGARR